MKKVSLIITAVALTVGVSQAFASNYKASKSSKANTAYRYTNGSGGILFTATFTTAQTRTGCDGAGPICAKAYFISGNNATPVPSFNTLHD